MINDHENYCWCATPRLNVNQEQFYYAEVNEYYYYTCNYEEKLRKLFTDLLEYFIINYTANC